MSDSEIDALYQVPLAEFTPARNALAKSRGAAGADIRKLEKPSLPAWGVNQLYWHERTLWDRLGDASLAVRQAHVAVISGRKADVTAAETAHQTALKEATAAVRRLIESAGDKATPATMDAVTETLQALPSQDPPGRLVKPLKPLGFAALMGLGIPIGEVPRSAGSRGPEVPGSRGSGVQGSKGSKGSEAREARARAAARKAAAQALRTAKAAEDKAEAAAAEAQKALATAERELDKTRDRLVFLEKQRADAETTARAKAQTLKEATNARIQAVQDLEALED